MFSTEEIFQESSSSESDEEEESLELESYDSSPD